MSKLNFAAMEKATASRSDRIIAHAIASVDLFGTTPQAIKFHVENGTFFVKFDVTCRKGETRTSTYICHTLAQLEAVTSTLAEKYGLEIIEEAL